jgi:hypothetical protein
LSIIKHVTLQKIVAHDFRYDPRIYKNGDKNLISNYRPISLLTSFSKILERVVFIRLCHHLTTNNVLADKQFCFRTNSSTEKAINRLFDHTFNHFKCWPQCGRNIL